MKLLTLSKRKILGAAAIVLAGAVAGVCAGTAAAASSSPSDLPTVVIDAGHGGIDAGVCGVNTGVKESDINLYISRELKSRFSGAGFNCVMTRADHGGLYGTTAQGFKMRDMNRRKEIIVESAADIVISVHQNTCPLKSRRGSHVFYDKESGESAVLAGYIQGNLNNLSGGVETNTILTGDYFMLKCTDAPSVIVECAFLSNAEDEQLLLDEQYREEIATAIFEGVIMYLS